MTAEALDPPTATPQPRMSRTVLDDHLLRDLLTVER